MQPSAATTPGIFSIIESAFTDALPLLRSRQKLWLIFAAIAALGGLCVPFLPKTFTFHQYGYPITWPTSAVAFQWPTLICDISCFFVIGSVLRTVRPQWHWTLRYFFTILGVYLLIVACVFSSFFLVKISWIFLPLLFAAYLFLSIKWSQTLWCYLLSEGKNPFRESWTVTNGMFWRTFLLAVMLWVVFAIGLSILVGIVGALAQWLTILAVAAFPLMYFCGLYYYHVCFLASVQWMLALRMRLHGALPPGAASMPATT
jgi:hypothetical protein